MSKQHALKGKHVLFDGSQFLAVDSQMSCSLLHKSCT